MKTHELSFESNSGKYLSTKQTELTRKPIKGQFWKQEKAGSWKPKEERIQEGMRGKCKFSREAYLKIDRSLNTQIRSKLEDG